MLVGSDVHPFQSLQQGEQGAKPEDAPDGNGEHSVGISTLAYLPHDVYKPLVPSTAPRLLARFLGDGRAMSGPGRQSRAGRGCAALGQVCKCRWLDTLILQAHLMEPIFNAKVRQLASAANGYFYVGNTGAGVDFASAGEWRASSCSLKSVDRAVEKCTRSYQGDVSQLLDCVRQCIVFDNMSDVLQAVRVIASDDQIHLLRIKNRLSRRSLARRFIRWRAHAHQHAAAP